MKKTKKCRNSRCDVLKNSHSFTTEDSARSSSRSPTNRIPKRPSPPRGKLKHTTEPRGCPRGYLHHDDNGLSNFFICWIGSAVFSVSLVLGTWTWDRAGYYSRQAAVPGLEPRTSPIFWAPEGAQAQALVTPARHGDGCSDGSKSGAPGGRNMPETKDNSLTTEYIRIRRFPPVPPSPSCYSEIFYVY